MLFAAFLEQLKTIGRREQCALGYRGFMEPGISIATSMLIDGRYRSHVSTLDGRRRGSIGARRNSAGDRRLASSDSLRSPRQLHTCRGERAYEVPSLQWRPCGSVHDRLPSADQREPAVRKRHSQHHKSKARKEEKHKGRRVRCNATKENRAAQRCAAVEHLSGSPSGGRQCRATPPPSLQRQEAAAPVTHLVDQRRYRAEPRQQLRRVRLRRRAHRAGDHSTSTTTRGRQRPRGGGGGDKRSGGRR